MERFKVWELLLITATLLNSIGITYIAWKLNL